MDWGSTVGPGSGPGMVVEAARKAGQAGLGDGTLYSLVP
jgi:hypothetical protein